MKRIKEWLSYILTGETLADRERERKIRKVLGWDV